MARLVLKIVLFSIPPIFFLVSVNYIYDPANLFSISNTYERTIADNLLNGNNVTNIGNMDERMLQKLFVENMVISPEVVVFGSSNSMYIDSDFFPGKRFINNAVSAASLNDFIAIYDLYEQKGFKPQRVILGICPEMLSDNDSQFWLTLEENYYSMRQKIGLSQIKRIQSKKNREFDKWFELISLSYFQQSTESAFSNSDIQPTKEKYNIGATRVIDGSYNDGDFYIRKSREEINNTVKRLINKPAVELETFKKLNSERTSILENFVDYLKEKGVEVDFYFLVYHPIYYSYVSTKYPILKEIQDYLTKLAQKKGINIIGDNNPVSCGITIDDFNDYSHLNKKGLLHIFSNPRSAQSILKDN